jgi:catalase
VSDPKQLAVEIVDAINDLAEQHEGHRAAHAKGTLLTGTFTATTEGSALTTAEHMKGRSVRVTARFSNGGADPGGPDHGKDGRGLAVKAYLEDGTTTDMVTVTLPVFFVRTPEDFLAFTRARVPDPETGQPDMAKLGPYFEAHPESLPAVQASLSAGHPESYASGRYNGLHAFRWANGDGASRWVRFSFEPEGGEKTIDEGAAKALGDDYLQTDVLERCAAGGVRFRLVLQLGEDGDPTDDPTVAWPEERETVVAGHLELTGPDTERERDGDVLVFDPTRVTEGIESSDDQILHIRSHAYAESVLRRSGVARA